MYHFDWEEDMILIKTITLAVSAESGGRVGRRDSVTAMPIR
jgi:hypothetical protein